MDSQQAQEVDNLLEQVRTGDSAACAQLIERVYPEVRRLARALMAGERRNHTLGATGTGLTNMLWTRLLRASKTGLPLEKVQNSQELLKVAARNMREILVDYARERNAQKRPNPAHRVDMDQMYSLGKEIGDLKPDVIDIHDALKKLEKKYPQHAQALEFKYFLGLTNDEGAAAMGSTVIAFRRLCDAAVDFLKRDLTSKRNSHRPIPNH